ncbi:hypothetical protein MOXK02_03980 [Moraxella sp. K02]
MAKLDLTQTITVNDVTYDPSDFYQRKLLVQGVQPTNYESHVFIDVLVSHKNTKTTQNGEKAGGIAQAIYRYQEIDDIHKFNEHQYPFYLDVVMTDIVDKKGETVQLILHADFDTIQEMQLVPRNQKPTNAASAIPAKP